MVIQWYINTWSKFKRLTINIKAMIEVKSNEFIIRIPTDSAGLVLDTIYAVVWHYINDGINQGRESKKLNPGCDIIRAIDPNDEILDRASSKRVIKLKSNKE